MKDQAEAIENEWYIVRHSGETPEIAYHSAIYYLTRAATGPQLNLAESQVCRLKSAAVERYKEIVLRDLLHTNCNTSAYRGIARSIVNYGRFSLFCARQQLADPGIRKLAASALQTFLETERALVQKGRLPSIINCSYRELQDFAALLGVPWLPGYAYLERYCPVL